MRILAGTSNKALSENLSVILGERTVTMDIRRFPDRELYIRCLEDIKDEDIVLVQSTYPDENALEFLLLSRLAKDLGAATVTGVIPYFGYARQDRIFNEGESFSARTMAGLVEKEVDNVVCVNLHKGSTLDEFRDVRGSVNISVMKVIGEFLRTAGIDMVLSPDKGAIAYAKETADVIGVDFDNLEKTRIDGSTVSIAPKKLDVEGKTVCIVDDIIATGGTIFRAQEALREQGVKEVHACCAHGLYTGGGIERLEPVLDGLCSSDTIESKTSAFSAAAPIADWIKERVE